MNLIKNFVFLLISHASIFSFSILIISGKAELLNNETIVAEKKWLTQLFSEAERNFDMNPSANLRCLVDYKFYQTHLKAQSGWAVRMLESSKWPSDGLLSGTTTHLGNWDECLLVSLPYMLGKYCLVEGTYNFSKVISNSSVGEAVEWPSDELTVWEILGMFEKNPVRAKRKTIQWALCIPSTCDHTDLEKSLRNVIQPLFLDQDLDFQINVNRSSCHVKDEMKFSREFYYAILFFLVVILLVSLSTVYDIMKKPRKDGESKELVELITSFSLFRNCNQLFHYSKNDFGFVHALKLISIVIIIYGHRRLYSLGYPNFNPERTELNFKKLINYVELTHLTFVDVFFMLTGFLTFHLEFTSMSKYGFRYILVAIVHRWMRLIPAFGAILIFLIYIFPYISDGPLWDAKVAHEINHCKASWWTTVLAINNIVQTENQCLVVSWYMSADIQLAVTGFCLLYITSKSRTWGWISVIATFFVGTVITFIVAYVHKFHAVLPIYVSFLQDPNSSEDFINFYITSYTRIGPYLVGAMTALITKRMKEKDFKFSTKQKVIGLLVVFIFGEGYQHLGYLVEYQFGHRYNVIEHALYAATYRTMFVLPCALMLCIYFTSGFSTLEKLYENRVFAALGRLTYSVFLVNTITQLFHAASQRSVLEGSILLNRFWWVAADVAFSYLFGVFMYLFLEAPVANISKLIKQKLLKKPTERNHVLPALSETTLPSQKAMGLM